MKHRASSTHKMDAPDRHTTDKQQTCLFVCSLFMSQMEFDTYSLCKNLIYCLIIIIIIIACAE